MFRQDARLTVSFPQVNNGVSNCHLGLVVIFPSLQNSAFPEIFIHQQLCFHFQTTRTSRRKRLLSLRAIP